MRICLSVGVQHPPLPSTISSAAARRRCSHLRRLLGEIPSPSPSLNNFVSDGEAAVTATRPQFGQRRRGQCSRDQTAKATQLRTRRSPSRRLLGEIPTPSPSLNNFVSAGEATVTATRPQFGLLSMAATRPQW
nr:hypothetical protein Itr_chr13CG08440 [Ipomoea trifida]